MQLCRSCLELRRQMSCFVTIAELASVNCVHIRLFIQITKLFIEILLLHYSAMLLIHICFMHKLR